MLGLLSLFCPMLLETAFGALHIFIPRELFPTVYFRAPPACLCLVVLVFFVIFLGCNSICRCLNNFAEGWVGCRKQGRFPNEVQGNADESWVNKEQQQRAKGDRRDVTLPLVQIPSAGSSLPVLDQSASFLHPENPLHGMNRISWNLQVLSALELRKERRWLLWHFTAAPGLQCTSVKRRKEYLKIYRHLPAFFPLHFILSLSSDNSSGERWLLPQKIQEKDDASTCTSLL